MGFVAPEVINPKITDSKLKNSPKGDIWSLGAVMYFLATKNYVFQASNEKELLRANIEGDVTLASRYFFNFSKECENNSHST